MLVIGTSMAGGIKVTHPTALLIPTFLILAMYNFVELNFIIFATFKKWSGLYFWSFIVATWGIAVYTTGFLLKDLNLSSHAYLYVTLIVVGWWCMVSGQSMVLYSRLHLVLYNQAWLRAVLCMIIICAVICYVPTTVLVYGANSANPDPFVTPYMIYEKIQVTIIFIQELTISALYISETLKLMRATAITSRVTNRRVMRHLFLVNVVVALLDTPILALEYANLYDLQTSYKALSYSVKLKLEFSILNRLVDAIQLRHGSSADQEDVTRDVDGCRGDQPIGQAKRRSESASHAGMGGGHDLLVEDDNTETAGRPAVPIPGTPTASSADGKENVDEEASRFPLQSDMTSDPSQIPGSSRAAVARTLDSGTPLG